MSNRHTIWLLLMPLLGCAGGLQLPPAGKLAATGAQRTARTSPTTDTVKPVSSVSTRPGATVASPSPTSERLRASTIVGLLKTASAALISNNSAGIVSDNGGSLISNNAAGYRLLNQSGYGLFGLAESASAGVRIEWVNADGQRMSDASASTDADGRFEISSPPDVNGAYLQARFTVNGKEMAYLSLPPAVDEGSADKPLLLDTANTIMTARVRESRRRGEAVARPAEAVLKRVRELLKPETVPFMGVYSEDVADTFDQLVNDDAKLNEEVVKANKVLQKPARAWQVQDWHTQASLRASGAVPPDMKFNIATTSRFEVDQAGNMYIIFGKGPASFFKITPAGVSTKLADLPENSRRPYTIARTPDGTMMVGCATVTGEVLLLRYDNQKFIELARHPFEQQDGESALTFQRMAARDDGTIYLTHRTGHSIWVRRAESRTLERLAGDPTPGYKDGPGLQARFNGPRAVTLGRDGALYVADGENLSIRRIDALGNVSTVAGQPNESEVRFGRGQYARLGKPGGVVATEDGTVFVTDITGNRVIRISPNGSVFLVAGSGQPGLSNGNGNEASFRFPSNLAFDGNGNLYMQDTDRISDTEAEIVLRRILSPKAAER